MNKIFKVIKNQLGNQVAVSELAKGKVIGAALALSIMATPALANSDLDEPNSDMVSGVIIKPKNKNPVLFSTVLENMALENIHSSHSKFVGVDSLGMPKIERSVGYVSGVQPFNRQPDTNRPEWTDEEINILNENLGLKEVSDIVREHLTSRNEEEVNNFLEVNKYNSDKLDDILNNKDSNGYNYSSGVSIGNTINLEVLNEFRDAPVLNWDTTVIGSSADANAGVALGAFATSKNGTAIGNLSYAKSKSVALGEDASAYGYHSVAIGHFASTTSSDSIAVGESAEVGGENEKGVKSHGIAIGKDSKILNGYNGVILGSEGKMFDDDATILGNYGRIGKGAKNSVALGKNSVAKEANVVSIGYDGRDWLHESDYMIDESELVINEADYAPDLNFDGLSPDEIREKELQNAAKAEALEKRKERVANLRKEVEEGNKFINSTFNRKIVHLAEGKIAEDSHEAINGSQLYKLTKKVEDLEMTTIAGDISDNVNSAIDNVIGNNLVAGENIKITETINPDTNRKTFTISAKGGNGSNIYIESDNGATVNSESGTIKITGDDRNLFTTTTDNKISVKLKDDVELNSITTGSVSVSTKGVNAGGHKVVNVAKGEINSASNDAVNGSQLYETNIQISKNTQKIGALDNHVNQNTKKIGALDNHVNQNTKKIGALDNRVNQIDSKVNRLRKENRAGIASVAAIAGLPEIHLAGKSMVSASAGTYRGENAIAVGYSRLSDDNKVKFKLSGSASTRGDFVGTVGVGYAW